MNLVFVTDGVSVDPAEVSSIQREKVDKMTDSGWPSGDPVYTTTFIGSVLTLKNGRKIYVPNQTPKQVHEKLAYAQQAAESEKK